MNHRRGAPPNPPQITHLLFDCDNTLVLSEDLAFEACATVANRILAAHNNPTRYDGPRLLSEFVGMNFRGMMGALQTRFSITLSPQELESYVKAEEDQVIATLKEKAEPCVGATEVLQSLYDEKKYGMAVVSSSALRRVQASIEKVDQARFFPRDHVFSAATSLEKPTSKPDPAVYLHACEVLGKGVGECVAVEDSKSGTLSAVRAGIPTMGYVGSYEEKDREEMTELLLKTGAKCVMQEWSEFREKLAEIENAL